MIVALRHAVTEDVNAIETLIARSARGLSREDYRPGQVEGALRGAFGVDTQLIRDATYFVAFDSSANMDPTAATAALIGCGGWSFRSTLFGGDARADRDASRLDPRTQAARIRAFFVDPAHARRGIASLLLERCEQEARLQGFRRTELMATLPGVRFYRARGYQGDAVVEYDVGAGEKIEFVPMRKDLA